MLLALPLQSSKLQPMILLKYSTPHLFIV
jgi:hypothetical protein